MAYIKVDGTSRAKTRMARNGVSGIRWNEDFEISVAKASEIEIGVFDKPDQTPVPIGMFWVKISDLVDELRRKKVEADNDAAWAAANAQDLARTPTIRPITGPLGDNPVNGVEGIEAWWDLEPIGQINLKLNFGTFGPICTIHLFILLLCHVVSMIGNSNPFLTLNSQGRCCS